MNAEIIAVGTELLLGEIVNTNAQFISQQLALLGIDVYFQTVVGDNPHRLRHVLEIARTRSGLVILTGGLGPTMDDITKDIVAEILERETCLDEASVTKLEEMFSRRGTPMVESNKRQAMVIEGATILPNETGLALGNALLTDGTAFILLPGPPREMKPMFEQEVIPWLDGSGLLNESVLHTRKLKFAGIGESKLEDRLRDLIETQEHTTIATYAKEGEVLVRLATKTADEREAVQRLGETELAIMSRIGEHLFAAEDISLPEALLQLMSERKLTLSAAESCTGGLFAGMITSVPGSSDVFQGGAVTYSNEMKERILGVPHELLEGEQAPGAVSAETSKAMAEGMQEIADTDFSIAITGVAGPGHSERKTVGLVYIAIAEKGRDTQVEELRLTGDRSTIRLRTVNAVMYRLWTRVRQHG
ncbi:competence/damage-inducible protein A [Paenibacillus popilliae]|uniref:Putative competence-damage inducible protein n=1 Tax=Paenibacillus popilliae ATCC 14706 TaxID=1212764 RepID=M9LJ62_PAEPP|nr:competence/damage-inducible protein A [Paenibacillus popilliae]GAC43205.1 predicted nucleotide-utilizing enzyme [Paenibacillus popilliae ATCC 14706]